MTAACARRGCRKRLPAISVEQGDPYCSAVCARLAHGLDGAASEGRWGRSVCRGCGCAYEASTAGCEVCEMRHLKRRKVAA